MWTEKYDVIRYNLPGFYIVVDDQDEAIFLDESEAITEFFKRILLLENRFHYAVILHQYYNRYDEPVVTELLGLFGDL